MTRHIKVTHMSSRQLSVTQNNWSSDGDDQVKNDPDVKNWIKEINKDFDPKTKTVTDDTEKKEEAPSSNAKNVSQLLSELYGEAETGTGSKENFSSVGEYLH